MAANTKPKTALDEELEQEMGVTKSAKAEKPATAKHQAASPEPAKYQKSLKSPKKGGGMTAAVIIFLVIIAAFVAIVGFNAFNIRNKYLGSVLRNIPIVKNLLPAETVEEDELAGLSKEELQAKIKELEAKDAKNIEQINSLNDKIKLYTTEITRLQEIEGQQLDFKAQKEEFDRLVGLNDPEAYAKFYDSVYPDTAAQIYREVIGINITEKELKNYVTSYSSMDPSNAAAIFDVMTGTDLDLVALIMKNLSSDSRGEIMAAMKPANAAAVTKRLAPVASP